MKKSLFLGTALATLLIGSLASAATETYKATLTGTQETPPTGSTATGSATITFDTTTKHITGTVTFTGMADADVNANGHHIHNAACGAAGGVALALPDSVSGTITIPDTDFTAHATELATGGLYVNLHTTAHPNGEIRGQLYLDGSGSVCPDPDAGTSSSGSSGTSGTSGTSGSSGASSSGTSGTSGTSGASSSSGSSGSNGAVTTRPDSGTTSSGGGSSDDSGCSTSGGEVPGGTLALTALAGIALLTAKRKRQK